MVKDAPTVAIIGAAGQLGGDLVDAFERSGRWRVVGLTHEQVEVTDPASVDAALSALRPAVVINTAAFNRVDDCENHPEAAFGVNALGALHVARAADRAGALCVYVSTDYVFDGRQPAVAGEQPPGYEEGDPPHPINVYGASKLAGEILTAQGAARYLVVRVASLFGRRGARGKGGNFVTTVLSRARAGETLRVVDDVVMSPTYTLDAACAIERLVHAGVTGTVHVVNTGRCSWYEFACAILRLAGLDAPVQPIRSADYLAAARRPAFSVLNNAYACSLVGHDVLRPWQEALAHYVAHYRGAAGLGAGPGAG